MVWSTRVVSTNLLTERFIMKSFLKFALVAAALVSVTPSVASAQTATVKVPMCLQVRDATKAYVPCTGIVPTDPATGNVINWGDAFAASDAAAGTANAKAKPVQNADGSKIASEASMVNAVTQLSTVVTRLSTLITNLGSPLQAGGNVGITGPLPAYATTPTMNVGTMPAVTITSQVLPTGAATEANLTTAVTRLTALVTAMQGTLTVNQTSATYFDVSVNSLTANQAAGTDPIIAADPFRRVFAITPINDGKLCIAGGGVGFCWALYAGVTRTISGPDCPQNALYITGQTAATVLPMAKG
jgi:hypothetical protein